MVDFQRFPLKYVEIKRLYQWNIHLVRIIARRYPLYKCTKGSGCSDQLVFFFFFWRILLIVIHNRRGIFYEEYFRCYKGNGIPRTTRRCSNKVRHKYRCTSRGSVIRDMRKDPVEEAKKKKAVFFPYERAMGRRERSEAAKRVSQSRDPRRCNGVIGYELTGSKRTVVPRCGSRRRKLVEGNRFIMREIEREMGEPDAKSSTKRRKRRSGGRTNNTSWMLRPPLSFRFFFVFIIYTYTCILCICSSRSSLLVSRLRVSAAAVLFHRAQSTWIRREAETHRRTFLRFSSIPRQIVPNYISLSLSFVLIFYIVSSIQESRALKLESSPRVCIRQSRSIRMT